MSFDRIENAISPMPALEGMARKEKVRAEVWELLEAERLIPTQLIQALKYRPDLVEAFQGPGAAGLSVEVHTERVLAQFEKYFSREKDVADKRAFMRLFLALHDVGKPRSIKEDAPEKEHIYTEKMMTDVMEELGLTEEQRRLARGLIAHDPIGEYLQGRISMEEAVAQIHSMSVMARIPSADMERLAEQYFQVDAGSYTKDAGGSERLDFLFQFPGPASRKIQFAQAIQEKLAPLRQAVSELGKQ